MAKGKYRSGARKGSVLLRRLRNLFGSEPAQLPIIEQNFAPYETWRRSSHLTVATIFPTGPPWDAMNGLLILLWKKALEK